MLHAVLPLSNALLVAGEGLIQRSSAAPPLLGTFASVAPPGWDPDTDSCRGLQLVPGTLSTVAAFCNMGGTARLLWSTDGGATFAATKGVPEEATSGAQETAPCRAGHFWTANEGAMACGYRWACALKAWAAAHAGSCTPGWVAPAFLLHGAVATQLPLSPPPTAFTLLLMAAPPGSLATFHRAATVPGTRDAKTTPTAL